MKEVLCFGELLLRFSPRLSQQWISEKSMPVYVGGAELNVALALAHFNIPVAYFTALPDNYLSKDIIDWLAGKRVDTRRIGFAGSRIGSYYLPQGTDLKGAGVIYDRAFSAFWELRPGEVDWDQVLQNIEWLHFSAITPALDKRLAEVCLEAVEAAGKKGITVSVDLNYRPKLWQYGEQPHEVMPALVQHCDVIMGNIWAEEKMLGISFSKDLKNEKQAYLEQSRISSQQLMQQFPKCRAVANTFRFDKQQALNYYATLFTDGELFVSREHDTASVVDRVGTGDTFMAGLVYGYRNQLAHQQLIDFAAAGAFNKLSIEGDFSTASDADIFKLIN